MGDEGVGCKAVEELIKRYDFPEDVECIDGGTAGFELLSLIENRDQVILIDAMQSDMAPGTVVRIEGEDVPRAFLSSLTPHQLGISDVLAAAQLTDDFPETLVLFGVVPKQLEVEIGLTEEIAAAMEKVLPAVVEELARFGYSLTAKKAS